MGQTTTQATTIPGQSQQQTAILNLLQQVAQASQGQLGNLQGLAGGQLLGPTGEDRALVQQSIGAAADIGQREIERLFPQLSAQISEGLAAKGQQGASNEFVQNILLGQQQQGRIADLLSQAQAQGGQALLNLPFQRAGVQLQANQQLFNQLLGAAGPIAQTGLGQQLGQPTTEVSQSGLGPQQIGQLGALTAAPFTGGASLGFLGLGGGGGSGFGFGSNQLLGQIQSNVGATVPQLPRIQG